VFVTEIKRYLTLLLVPLIGAFSFVSCQQTEIEVGDRQKEKIAELARGEVLNRTYFFKEAKKDQSYTLYIPKSYHHQKSSPLIILLHGLRSNPSQIMRYQGIIEEAEKRGYVLVAPYGYNERGWYGSRGKGKKGIGFGKAEDPDNLGELSEKDVMNVLEIVKSELTIDPKRIFILGHSMGGGGALHLAVTYPHEWSGIGCLAPSFQGHPSQLKKAKHIPAIVVTGDKDFLVPVEGVRRWIDEMKLLKMDVTYKEIKGGRHFRTISRNPEMIADVFEFFDKVKK
jgi:poly(3-hydroxybutyrate) depolymerase